VSAEPHLSIDKRTQAAIDELRSMIRVRYPGAIFAVSHGQDPEGIYLDATVDIEDVDEVLDVVRDRLFDLQVEEGIPVYVIPLEPEARVMSRLEARSRRGKPRS
jgi:hypothetical protein